MSERKHVRIEYRLREDADAEAYVVLVNEFVANIGSHAATNEYAAYRDAKDPRHFVHVGHFDADQVESLQSQPFFKAFTTRQRDFIGQPPDVAMLHSIASTR